MKQISFLVASAAFAAVVLGSPVHTGAPVAKVTQMAANADRHAFAEGFRMPRGAYRFVGDAADQTTGKTVRRLGAPAANSVGGSKYVVPYTADREKDRRILLPVATSEALKALPVSGYGS